MLSKARAAYLKSNDPTLQNVEQIPDDFNEEHHHNALAMQYIADAYGAFLSGADDFTEQDRFLEERYGEPVVLLSSIKPNPPSFSF